MRSTAAALPSTMVVKAEVHLTFGAGISHEQLLAKRPSSLLDFCDFGQGIAVASDSPTRRWMHCPALSRGAVPGA